jgi:hypothetical protein
VKGLRVPHALIQVAEIHVVADSPLIFPCAQENKQEKDMFHSYVFLGALYVPPVSRSRTASKVGAFCCVKVRLRPFLSVPIIVVASTVPLCSLGGILGRSSFSAEPCAIRGGVYLVVIKILP